MGDFDRVLAFCRVVGAELGKQSPAVLVALRGLADGDDAATAEGAADEPVYGAGAVLFRPMLPNDLGAAEAVCGRTDDGLPVIAMRDLRISKSRGSMQLGSASLCGYNGSFLGTDKSPDGTGDVVTLYVPYEHDDDGVPAKAHAITIDTTIGNESITIAHADGAAVILAPGGELILKGKDDDKILIIDAKGVTTSGVAKATTGLVVGSAAVAKPVVIDPSGLGLWFAQVQIALTQIAVKLNAPGPVTGAPGSVAPVVAPPPVPSTIAKAAPTP